MKNTIFIIFFQLFFTLFSFSEGVIPHQIITSNPQKEVTEVSLDKKFKEKAELNLNITKLNLQSVNAALDKNNRKIFFSLDNSLFDGELEMSSDDLIYLSEVLEEVPSTSTTNGKKRVNNIKNQKRYIEDGVIEDGNLTYKVRQLKNILGTRNVEITYKTLPGKIYIGLVDRNYKLKKIFVLNYIEIATKDFKEYFIQQDYQEDIQIKEDENEIEIKISDLEISSIVDKNILENSPYIKFLGDPKEIKLRDGKNVYKASLRLVKESGESIASNSYSSEIIKNSLGEPVASKALKTSLYLTFPKDTLKTIKSGKYSVEGISLRYGLEKKQDNFYEITIPSIKIFKERSAPLGNNVEVKLWLFGEEIDKNYNIILSPQNNSNGFFQIRPNDDHVGPENSRLQKDSYSVFDMKGSPVYFDFNETDIIEIEPLTGVTGIENNLGSFDRYRNKYAKASISGYEAKARIWTEFSGIELSLDKRGGSDYFSEFNLIHKTKDNQRIQTINFKIYSNNKTFREYFKVLTEKITIYNGNGMNFFTDISKGKKGKWLTLSNGSDYVYKIENFVSDEIEIRAKETFDILRTTHEEEKVDRFISVHPSSYQANNLQSSSNSIINGGISKIDFFIESDWYIDKSETNQMFFGKSLEIKYGAGKRNIDIDHTYGIYRSWTISFEEIQAKLIGLPKLNQMLNGAQINGERVFDFSTKTQEFQLAQSPIYSRNIKILVDDDKVYESSNILDTNLTFESEGVKFGVEFNRVEAGYNIYSLNIKNMELDDEDREIEIESIDSHPTQSREVKRKNIINIPRFDVGILKNKFASSISEKILLREDINKNSEILKKRIINLGTLYFKHLDVEILKENSTSKPAYILASDIIIMPEDNNSALNSIKGKLSFSSTDENLDIFEMDINNSNLGGGNGKNVYLHISANEYEKLVRNGGNVRYRVLGKFHNSNYSNVLAKIIFLVDKSSLKDSDLTIFTSEIINELIIETTEISPSVSSFQFLENVPLITSYFEAMDSSFKFLAPPSREYNRILTMSGEIQKYDYTQPKHKYELTDSSGTREGYIGTNGSGAVWEDVDIGNGNQILVAHERKDSPINSLEKTYFKLSRWNFESSSENVTIKHYKPDNVTVNQYYEFNFRIPSFNPYIYYNENYSDDTLKIGEGLNIVRKSDTRIVYLGKIATNGYDTEITKHFTGDKYDNLGLRIIPNRNLSIYEKETGIELSEKAEIVFLDSSGNEIGYNPDTIMVGKNQVGIIGLKLPESVSRNKKYTIRGEPIDKFMPDNCKNYILKIGRNGYFKEIISEISLETTNIFQGETTIKLNPNYIKGSYATFKGLNMETNEIATLIPPIPDGLSIKSTTGNGILKLIPGDYIEIFEKENPLNRVAGVVDNQSYLSIGKLSTLNENSQIFYIVNGNLQFAASDWRLGLKDNISNLEIVVKRNDLIVMKHSLSIEFPDELFRVLKKESLDFGNISVGYKDNYSSAKIIFEIPSGSDIEYSFDTSAPEIFNLKDPTKKLIVRDFSSYYNKNSGNNSEINIEGYLDVEKGTTLGEYKGILNLEIQIRY